MGTLMGLIAIALAAFLLRWIYRSPVRGIYLSVLLLPVLVGPRLPAFEHKLTWVDGVLALTLLAAGLRWLRHPEERTPLRLDRRVGLALLAFLGAGLLSFLNTPSLMVSAIEWGGYAYMALYLTLFVQLVHTERRLRVVVRLWLGATALVVAGAGLQLVALATGFGREALLWEANERVTSTFQFVNQLPSYLVSVLPVLILLALERRGAVRLGAALLALGVGGSMLATESRTVFLLIPFALALSLALFPLLDRRHGRLSRGQLGLRWAGGLALLGAFALFAFALRTNALGLADALSVPQSPLRRVVLTLKNGDWNPLTVDLNRWRLLSDGWDAVLRHPLLGVGLGAFRLTYPGVEAVPHEVHNALLSTWAEAGTLGLLALLALLGLALRRGWAATFQLRDLCWGQLAGAVGIGWLSNLLIYGFFIMGLRQRHFWFSLALLLGIESVRRGKAPWRDG